MRRREKCTAEIGLRLGEKIGAYLKERAARDE